MNRPYDPFAPPRETGAPVPPPEAAQPVAAPVAAVTAPLSEAPLPDAALLAPPPPAPSRTALTVLGLVLTAAATGGSLSYLVVNLGVGPVLLGSVLALIPLAIVASGLVWVARWNPPARIVVATALLWGSGVAVGFALLAGAGIIGGFLSELSFRSLNLVQLVVLAPITEEIGKGLGLLILVLAFRDRVNGPIDGLILAGWVAAGFAFLENILYFGDGMLTFGRNSDMVSGLFVGRGILSPFAHVMFTACMGVMMGYAARRPGTGRVIGFGLLGLIPAMGLHAVWNGAVAFDPDRFFLYYLLIQVPLFAGAILLVVRLRHQDARRAFARLTEFGYAGWFPAAEVESLTHHEGRRIALFWARQRGAGREMLAHIRAATRLSVTRDRLHQGFRSHQDFGEEYRALHRALLSRQRLHARLMGPGPR